MALARAGLTQHERIHEDSRKRKRHRKSGKRIVVLVGSRRALGEGGGGLRPPLFSKRESQSETSRRRDHRVRHRSAHRL